MCFYCRSYIVNKTFSKYNSKSTNNFSFRNELNDIILQKLFRQGGSTFSYLLLPVLYPYRIDFHRFLVQEQPVMLNHPVAEHFPEDIAAELRQRGVDKQILFFQCLCQ